MNDQHKTKAELITELAELRQELAHFQALSEVTTEGIVLHEKGLILEVNEALARLTGVQRAEMVGKPVFDFLPAESWDTVRHNIQTGYDKPYESLLLHKSGAKISVEFLGKNYFYQGREVRTTIVRDITERKLTEAQLQKNQQQLELVMAAADLGTWSLNPQTGEDIIDERAAAMLGYTVAEIEPHISWWDERTHPDDIAHAQEVWNAHVEGCTPFYECEYRVRAKSGEWVWIFDRGNIVERDQSGQPLRVVGTHLDITQRKHAEEALRKSEAMNRALFEAMPDLVIRLNRNGDYLDFQVPKGFRAINPADETIGKNVFELLPAKIAQQRLQQIEKALQTGEVQVAEYQLNLPHGTQYEEARIVPTGDDEVLAIIRDITERKRAEQAIDDQQALLSQIIDVLPVGVIVKDVQDDYRFTIWNSKMEEMLGIKREELLGKTDYDHSPREQADFYRQTDMAVIAGGQMIDVPVEEITTVQGPRLAHTVKLPMFDNQGTPQFLLAVLEDITERKQAELERERLLTEVQRLAAIVENHPDFISVGSLDARALYINPAGLKMLGLPPDCDVTTLDMRQFFAQDDDTERVFRAGVQTAFAQGSWSTELTLTRVDGSKIPVEETISINRDASGKPHSLSITMRDITERKQAAEELLRRTSELEESRNFFDSIIENLPVMLFIKEAKELRHVRWNKAGLELLGRKLEDMVGKNDYDFFPKDEADFFAAKDRETLNSGQVIDIWEEPIQTTDKGIRWLYTRKVPIHGADGRPNYLLGISVDITERKQAEESLRASEARNLALLNAIPDLIIRYSQDGTYLDVKPSKEFPPFRPPEEMIGKKLVDLAPPKLADQRLHHIHLALQTGQTQTYEHHYPRDGHMRHEESWVVPSGKDEVFVVVRDMTARVQAEQTIAQQREILDKIINNLPVGVFAKDAQDEYRFTIFNAKMEEMFGTRREDMLGKNDYDLFADKEEVDNYRRTDVAVMEGGQVVDIPVEEVTTSRGVMLSHTTKLPIYDDQGRPQLLLGVLDDITERKQAEEVLRESRQRIDLILQGANLGTWDINLQTDEGFVDQRAVEMLGYNLDEVQPRFSWWGEQTHPDDMLPARERWNAHIEGKTDFYEAEYRLRTKSGEWKWILDRGQVVEHDKNGQPLRVAGTHLDITERKQVEETLRQNEARLAEAADIAQLGYWEFDVQTQMFTFTDQFYALFRTSAAQEGGYQMPAMQYAQKFVHPAAAHVVGAEIQKSIETTEPNYAGQVDHKIMRADGSEGYIIVRYRVIKNGQGQTVKLVGINQDITQRKQVEEKLRENEARLFDALAIAELGSWEFDVATQVFILSDQLYSMLHTTADQEGGYVMPAMQYIQKFVHPEDAYIIGAEIQKAIETTDPNYSAQIEYRLIRADGSEGYILVRYRVIKDEQGRTIKGIGVNQDITDRKRTELEREHLLVQVREALTTADRFRQFVEASAQGIGWADLEGNVIYVNPTLCRFFGEAKPEDVYGRPVTLYYPEEVQRRLQAEIFPTIIREGSWSGELLIASKDGRLTPTLNTLFLVRDENNQPLYLANLLTDITERKQAEEALQASETRNRALLNAVPDLIIRLSQDGTYLDVKAAKEFASITSLDDMLGRTIFEMLPPEMAKRQSAYIGQALQSGEIQIYEQQLVREGRQVYEEVRMAPSGDNEALMMIRDITDRKQAEQELKEAQERAQTILESVTVPMLISRVSDGVMLYANTPLARLMLLPREELMGQQTPNFYDDPAERATVIGFIRSQGAVNDYELRLRRSNGEVFWALLSARVFNFQGEPAIITLLIDITERKQAEAERARLLAEVEATYRQYVQREWEQFLGEQSEAYRAVYQPTNVPVPVALDNLAHLEQAVLREGKTKTLAPAKANGHSSEAAIVAPLALRGQVIGAVSLQDVDPERAWTAEEVALVEAVSEQLALTVENLRLFKDTQKQATREQITRQITDKMRAAPDMDTIIQTGLTELAKALNLSRAYVKLTTQPEAEQS